MPESLRDYSVIEKEVGQMELKAESARKEIIRLTAIADTCETQAESLRHAILKQMECDYAEN